MDEQKNKYLSDMEKYLATLKKKMIVAYAFFLTSIVGMIVSLILTKFVDGQTSSTIFIISYFIPAIYTLPMALKTINNVATDVEPSYDLYIHGDGRITAQEDARTQGERIGNLFIIIFTFAVYALISPIILLVKTLKNEKKYKTAKKNYKQAQIEQ